MPDEAGREFAWSVDRQIRRGLKALGLPLSGVQIDQLTAYVSLLDRWNSKFNLTAIRDPATVVTRHIFDSLSLSYHLQGQHFADIGSGAGLPGIPLAIANPERRFTLVDSNGKKTRFQFQAKAELGLDNIETVNTRVQIWQPETVLDGIICRAYASLSALCQDVFHLMQSGALIYAMKGREPLEEIGQLPEKVKVENTVRLTVPGLGEARHLVTLKLK